MAMASFMFYRDFILIFLSLFLSNFKVLRGCFFLTGNKIETRSIRWVLKFKEKETKKKEACTNSILRKNKLFNLFLRQYSLFQCLTLSEKKKTLLNKNRMSIFGC